MAVNAQHSQASCEHGSPEEAVELARHTLGTIDLDPASSLYWNRFTVAAKQFFDRQADGLVQPWTGNVWLNPPGADEQAGTPSLVRPFWERLTWHWRLGSIEGAIYHGYSLEQLQMLQSSPWPSPANCIVLIYSKRLQHLRRPQGGGPPEKGESPTHGSFAALLPSRRFDSVARAQVARFLEHGSELGDVVRPLRA